MSFAYKFRELVKEDYFSLSDIKALIELRTKRTASDAAIHNGVSRALRTKEIIQIKRGLYLFSQKLRKGPISKFVLANKMYSPSYISFESALSHYGLIPEAVHTTTSACYQRKSKKFVNELGEFSFEFIPCTNFFLAVTQDSSKGGALIAKPLRAFFDLMYLRKKKYQSIAQLEDDLRIETARLKEEVQEHSLEEIEELAKQYKKKNIIEIYGLLTKAYK